MRPVDVGSLLALRSAVVHVDGSAVCVDVSAAVWVPDTRSTTLTNNFHFVFDVHDAPRPLKAVLPANDHEAAQQLRAAARLDA